MVATQNRNDQRKKEEDIVSAVSAGDKEVGNDQLTDDPDFMASDEPPDEFHSVTQNNNDLYRNGDQSESEDKEDDEAQGIFSSRQKKKKSSESLEKSIDQSAFSDVRNKNKK